MQSEIPLLSFDVGSLLSEIRADLFSELTGNIHWMFCEMGVLACVSPWRRPTFNRSNLWNAFRLPRSLKVAHFQRGFSMEVTGERHARLGRAVLNNCSTMKPNL